MTENKTILTIDVSEGQEFLIAGGNYRIIISGKQTDGKFAVIEMSVPPGAGPNPHSHANFTESFYVLEGEVAFKSESGNYIAKKGSFINIPEGGMIHGFKNVSNIPAKLLCTVIPAGLDDFFEEIAAYLTANSNAEIDKIKSISEKYGQKIYPENYLDNK